MASAALEESGGGKKGMPTWRPPPALGEGGLTELWDRLYPLKVYNSLTRTKVCVSAFVCVPGSIGGSQRVLAVFWLYSSRWGRGADSSAS